ncbi:hypothetical protein RI639_09990, partial [Pseudomonas aeruginosa]
MPTLSRRLLWPLAILLLVLGRPLAAADLYYVGGQAVLGRQSKAPTPW